MLGRIIEVTRDKAHLSVERGHMRVEIGEEKPIRVALDDIAVLLINSHGVTYSNHLLTVLAERGALVVLCGRNHSPVAWLWPLDNHFEQSGRMAAQLRAKDGTKKRIWQALVRAKIRNQAAVVDSLGLPAGALAQMVGRVRPGDPGNIEGQVAQRYWPMLFGPGFARNRARHSPALAHKSRSPRLGSGFGQPIPGTPISSSRAPAWQHRMSRVRRH